MRSVARALRTGAERAFSNGAAGPAGAPGVTGSARPAAAAAAKAPAGATQAPPATGAAPSAGPAAAPAAPPAGAAAAAAPAPKGPPPAAPNTAPQAGFGAAAKGAPPAAGGGGSASSGGGGGGGGALMAAALIALPAGAYLGYQSVMDPAAPAKLPALPWPLGQRGGAGGNAGGAAPTPQGGAGDPLGAGAGPQIAAAPVDDLAAEEVTLQHQRLGGAAAAAPTPAAAKAPAAAAGAGAAAAAAAAAGEGAERGAREEQATAAARVAGAMDAAAAAAAAAEAGAAAAPAGMPAERARKAGEAVTAAEGEEQQRRGDGQGVKETGFEEGLEELAAVKEALRGLGPNKDISPSGLVAAAAAAGYGPKDDWAAAAAQLRQATADAVLLGHAVQDLAARQQQLEAALAREKAARAAAEQEAERKGQELVARFKALMEQQRAAAGGDRAAAVRAAEERVAADAAKHQLAERLERSKSIDGIREKVNSLSAALSRRSSEARAGTEAHRAALGAMALARALEDGRPLARELQALESGCPDDSVVSAVVKSLSHSAAASGLPTQAELEKRFETVAKATLQLAYFPPNTGGILAHAVASAAAALKADAGPHGAGVDAAVSRARSELRAGRLLAAADTLARAAAGSEAAGAVEGWVRDARARALADQNARLLHAHATSTAAALA